MLDNCMGSGSTGVACVKTGRSFIGIEKEQHWYDVARNRIDDAYIDMQKGVSIQMQKVDTHGVILS